MTSVKKLQEVFEPNMAVIILHWGFVPGCLSHLAVCFSAHLSKAQDELL